VGTTLGVTGQLSTANVLKATGNPGLSAAGATEGFLAHNTGYGAIIYGQGTTSDVALLDRNTGLRLSVTTSGAQVSGDLSMTSGNVVMATSGKGIDFSATAGTGTSELLADYEEGTWTGTVTGGTFTNLTTGRYTKIGRQVFASITPNTTAITGNLVISGLPFASGARSAMVVAAAPPTGVTYIPLFVDSTDIYVNVSGTYAAGSVSTYFAFTYDV
jgi:hypothetical protein